MSESEFKNIVIFVSDSLRCDSMPEQLTDKDVITTLAPSLHTPTSFTSLFTSLSPEKHNVRGFMQDLETEFDNPFEKFENSSFYDGPNRGTLTKHIFREKVQDLDEIEPPFIWIERMLDTHVPYGEVGHNRQHDWKISGREYLEKGKKGEIDLEKEYQRGTEVMQEYVLGQIDYLEKEGLLDETLVIITSDHGEALGERFMTKKRYGHNYPPIREIAQVPTVFYNYDLDVDFMRLIDVIPTAMAILGKEIEGDGVDVRKESVKEGTNIMHDSKVNFKTQWRFNGENWEPTRASDITRRVKTIVGDSLSLIYRKGYKRLEKEIESKTEEKEKTEELEGIDI